MRHKMTKQQAYLDEVTLVSNTSTTDVDLGSLLLARFDVRHDTLEISYVVIFVIEKGKEGGRTHVELDLGDLWSLVYALDEGVTDLDFLDLFGELFKEFVVDSRLDEDTSTSAASLTVVPAEQQSD